MTPQAAALLDYVGHAYFLGASDIHIEPTRDAVEIRLRLNGSLTPLVRLQDQSLFLERVKATLGFDMSIAGVPQDVHWAHPSESVDCRANLMPVRFGEKICLRLLQRDKAFHLNSYALAVDIKAALLELLQKKSGLIILSGPTGSGKSTLLYSLLGSLDRERLNICTIEDPIEYTLTGINQSAVLRKKGFDFASALRALMRQDPDVIMIGEIRDRETAAAAVHAASTGHLVLSTVHATSAAQVLDRMETLGVPRPVAESCLLFASAQRLAQTLCPQCKEKAPEDGALVKKTFATAAGFTPMRARGCEVCKGSGVGGRHLVFECLIKDTTLQPRGCIKKSALDLLQQGWISAREAYAQCH